MQKDVSCPYCGAEQKINHDDGYGYEEYVLHKQQCDECGQFFTFCTSILYVYEAYKADCLNGAPHDFHPTRTYPKVFTMMECTACGEYRKPTDDEMKEILSV